MNLKCPRCGLFSLPGAQRCDCAPDHDFETGQQRRSYLFADAAKKPGGVRRAFERRGANTMWGAVILAIGVLATALNYWNGPRDADGARQVPRVAWIPVIAGAVWLVRGLHTQ